MYFHGLEDLGQQVTRVATSPDGIHFTVHPEILGKSYCRVFPYQGYIYAMAMPGQFYRSKDGLSAFVAGPLLFNNNMRHTALRRATGRWPYSRTCTATCGICYNPNADMRHPDPLAILPGFCPWHRPARQGLVE